MASSGKFNIFDNNYNQPHPNQAISMFSNTTSKDNVVQINSSIKAIKQRKTIINHQIRINHHDEFRKNKRNQLIKMVNSKDFYLTLELLAKQNSKQLNDLSTFLSTLKQNAQSYHFCQNVDNSDEIKEFLLKIYQMHTHDLSIKEKSILLNCILLITYYGYKNMNLSVRINLNQMLSKEIQSIKNFNAENIQYFRRIVDLLINLTSDVNQEFDLYLIESNTLQLIISKINEISEEAENVTKSSQGQDTDANFRHYKEILNDMRNTFIDVLTNLSRNNPNNKILYELTINQFFQDVGYLNHCFPSVLKILNNFCRNQDFRFELLDKQQLIEWFMQQIFPATQIRFIDKNKMGKYQNVCMTQQQKQIFYYFLQFLINLLNYQNADIQVLDVWIAQFLNPFCLSQFLIQSANLDKSYKKNTKYLSKAIEMYEYLASNKQITINQLLVVTSQRNSEDILKALLQKTCFQSVKIAPQVFLLLNKMLSKDPNIVKSLIELEIIDRIIDFTLFQESVKSVESIIYFLQLLTLMIASEEDINKKNESYIAKKISQTSILKKIQSYQDHDSKNIAQKAEAVLTYIKTFTQNYQNQI